MSTINEHTYNAVLAFIPSNTQLIGACITIDELRSILVPRSFKVPKFMCIHGVNALWVDDAVFPIDWFTVTKKRTDPREMHMFVNAEGRLSYY